MIRKLAAAAVVLGAAITAMPAIADPPPWAPANGYRAKQHRYVYYPEREIYYEPEQRMWFWLDGGNWRVGASLPGAYVSYATGGVNIELNTDRPYTEHAYVVEHYGKGKGGKGNGGKGNGKGKGNGHGNDKH
jgi:hypothetical protein